MRVLFISRWFPHPPDNGSRIRVFNLLKHLSARHEVHLVSFASEAITDEQRAAMEKYCARVEAVVYQPFKPQRGKALAGFFSPRPRSVVDTYSSEMQQLIEGVGRTSAFDVIVASQLDAAPYALALNGAPKLIEEVELTTIYEQFARQRQPLRKLRSGLTWWKLSRYVAGLLRRFEGCTVVSVPERGRVWQVLPGYQPIGIIPNGVDLDFPAAEFGAPQADTLVYSGALTYQANFDAMEYFLREVFPLIQAERPGVKLFITGRLDGVPVQRLATQGGVVFTGYLSDVRPTVARSWVSLAPLRVGGGTRLKILEALALGTPVVATSKGVEGLDLIPERDFLLADTADDFVRAVLRLLREPGMRWNLSRNGRRVVAARYDWRVIGQQFSDFVEAVVAEARPMVGQR